MTDEGQCHSTRILRTFNKYAYEHLYIDTTAMAAIPQSFDIWFC
jgi:hypothetical protein